MIISLLRAEETSIYNSKGEKKTMGKFARLCYSKKGKNIFKFKKNTTNNANRHLKIMGGICNIYGRGLGLILLIHRILSNLHK